MTETAWFRVPETTRTKFGATETVPEHIHDAAVTSFSCARLTESPAYIVHVRATTAVLDGLRSTPGVTERPETDAVAAARASPHVDDAATAASFRV